MGSFSPGRVGLSPVGAAKEELKWGSAGPLFACHCWVRSQQMGIPKMHEEGVERGRGES